MAKRRMTAELRAELDDKVIRFVHLGEIVLVVLVVALMVFKPY